MYLSDILDKNEVLEEAFKHPSMKIKPRAKAKPTLDMAFKAIMAAMEFMTTRKIAGQVQPLLQGVYDTHVLLSGEWSETDNKDEWESGLDDEVEAAIAPWVPSLSNDWLGRHTIACGLHEQDGVAKFATSLGKEVFKQLTYEFKKTPAQIMSNAGIFNTDVEAMLDAHLTLTEEDKETMAHEQEDDIKVVISLIAEHVGKDYDITQVYDDFDLASDEDDGLAFGAGARIGIGEDSVRVLQAARFEHEADTAEYLSNLLKEYFTGEKPAKKAAAKAPAAAKASAAPKAAKPAKAAAPAPETGSDAIDPAIFVALRDSGGAKDTDMATGMGVSRATYNNWSLGKTNCVPSTDKRDFLRGTLVEKANALLEALALLDGTEAETIF